MSDPWVPVVGGPSRPGHPPVAPAAGVDRPVETDPHEVPAAPAGGEASPGPGTHESSAGRLTQREPQPPADHGESVRLAAPSTAGNGEPAERALQPAAGSQAEPSGADPTTGVDPFRPAGVAWRGVSPRLVTVRLISAGLALSLPLAGGVLLAVLVDVPALWVVPALVLALAVWVAVVVPRQVRAIGYAERDDDLLIRKGVLLRTLVVVPYGRMQFVDVQAGPLDRWGGIARVQLHTASPGSDAAIPGLTPAEAARMRDRLAARGEAQLAGL